MVNCKYTWIGSSNNCCNNNVDGNPDYITKQHSTYPSLRIEVTDCNGEPYDLKDLIIEASMWTNAKLKNALTISDNLIKFADNFGYDSVGPNSILHVSNGRDFERMSIIGFDDVNKIIEVQRGSCGTALRPWAKGTSVKILRFFNSPASSEMVLYNKENLDGTISYNVLQKSFLIYDWKPEDVCFIGKYYFEFKVLKMGLLMNNNETASIISSNDINYHCDLGIGVEWARRFPNDKDGFVIEVKASPTAECA